MRKNPDTQLVEIVENTSHPWFVGVQFHPEYKSTVAQPHPLFVSFASCCIKAPPKQEIILFCLMEERKFDPYQFIGFVLIALILTWMLYHNAPEEATPATPEPTPAVATPEATPGPATAVVSATAVDTSMYGPFAGFMQANAAAPQQLKTSLCN